MKYRLSLDLGVSSIGIAVTALDHDNEATAILDSAVRIFPVSEGAEDRRTKRQARKNNMRTKKRLKRLAVKLHEKGFWVSADPASPENLSKQPPYNLSPYAIRYHAIRGKLNSPYELGRALLHMAKHRGAGFIDAMAEAVEEDVTEAAKKSGKKQKKLSSYELLPKYMQEKGATTIGEYFHMRLKQEPGKGKVVRQRRNLVKEKPVDFAIPRYLVIDEFHRIWDKQAAYYSALRDEAYKQGIHDILFYEHPSAPFATADCIYVDGEKRLLKAHPLSEKRRIYEAVNNIRLLTDSDKRKLKKIERDAIISEILMQGKNANKTSVRETLGFDRTTDVLFSDKETGIKPYLYSKEEFTSLPVFSGMTEEKLADLAQFMAEPVNEADKLKRLFSENELIAQLQERLAVDDEKQIGELLAKLPKGRGMIGITATREILKLLETGIPGNDTPSHREVTDYLVSKGDGRFKAEEVLAQEIQGKFAFLPYYGEVLKKDTQPIHPWQITRNKTLNPDEARYGKIANPAVHRMLNQLQRVVNDIIRIHGRPYEINIELGRDVGMSAKKKAQYESEQKRNQKANDEAAEYLKDKRIKVTRENILKYKLAKEQHWQDAFNPQGRIHPRFEGVEIEHLIPQSTGGSDTPANLVLVDRRENATKSNQYPYDYFLHNKTPEQTREILKAARANLSGNKSWRFEPDAREKFEEGGDEDETNRYLTDTRYMAKLAARYLRTILDFDKAEGSDITNTRILTVKGAHTAKLRTAWNLDGLEYELMGLDVSRHLDCESYWKDEETGEIKDGAQEPEVDGKWKFCDKKKNPEWKKKPRIDHRHHALDAIALGCINRNFSSRLNWVDKRGYTLNNSAYPLPLADMDEKNAKAERTRFRQQVLELLKETRVSHKAEHAKNGQLHKELGKAVLVLSEEHKDKTITRKTRKILQVVKAKSDLSKLLIKPAIKSEWHADVTTDREQLEKLAADFEAHYAEAKTILEHRNITLKEEGKKAKELSEAMVLAEAFRLIKEKGLWKGEKFPTYTNEKSLIIIEKHNMAYTSGNNHRVDFYEKDGMVCWQVINNYDANNPDFIPDGKKSGSTPIWSLHQGDLIELDTPEQWRHFTNAQRCIARVKKFSDRLNIAFHSDSRMDSPPKDSPDYMVVQQLGLGFGVYGKHTARKIELKPAGSIRKKHKKLWHGKKAAA
jgi:CRISPR-associated endonuclease Csn1